MSQCEKSGRRHRVTDPSSLQGPTLRETPSAPIFPSSWTVCPMEAAPTSAGTTCCRRTPQTCTVLEDRANCRAVDACPYSSSGIQEPISSHRKPIWGHETCRRCFHRDWSRWVSKMHVDAIRMSNFSEDRYRLVLVCVRIHRCYGEKYFPRKQENCTKFEVATPVMSFRLGRRDNW